MKDSGKIIGALLLGATVGAVVGILYAPDKGSETRRKLIDGAKDFTDDLKKKVMEASDKYNDLFDEASHYADDEESKFDEYKSKTKNKANQYSTTIS